MLIKNYTAPNRASTAYHDIKAVVYSSPNAFLLVTVNSYATQDDLVAGTNPAWASTPIQIPRASITGELVASVEAWLVADQGGPFYGATIAGLDDIGLAAARLKQWALLKSARDAAVFAGFEWDGSRFDCDVQSQVFIEGAALLATLALMELQPFALEFTLQDNSVRTLTGADMLAVGQAMGTHVMTVHAIGRGLRAAIEAADSVADVTAVAWPA